MQYVQLCVRLYVYTHSKMWLAKDTWIGRVPFLCHISKKTSIREIVELQGMMVWVVETNVLAAPAL